MPLIAQNAPHVASSDFSATRRIMAAIAKRASMPLMNRVFIELRIYYSLDCFDFGRTVYAAFCDCASVLNIGGVAPFLVNPRFASPVVSVPVIDVKSFHIELVLCVGYLMSLSIS